jgi:hypothetical protein
VWDFPQPVDPVRTRVDAGGVPDRYAWEDEDQIPAELARLRNEISCELYAQLVMRLDTIEQDDVAEVAYAVAVRLRTAYRLEWAPCWADDRTDDEPLSLDSAVFHGSAGTPDRYPIFDHGWPAARS